MMWLRYCTACTVYDNTTSESRPGESSVFFSNSTISVDADTQPESNAKNVDCYRIWTEKILYIILRLFIVIVNGQTINDPKYVNRCFIRNKSSERSTGSGYRFKKINENNG